MPTPADPGYPVDLGGTRHLGTGGPSGPDSGPGAPGGEEPGGARVDRRRRVLFAAGIVVAVALLVGGVVWLRGGDEDERSPEDTVRQFFEASMDQDCEELVDLVVERSWSEGGTVDREAAIEQCDADLTAEADFDAELHEVEVTSEDGSEAVVEVRYSFEGEDVDTSLDLEKEDGSWKVTNT